MPEFTIPRRSREPHSLKFTYDEACAMAERGFRFGTFRPQEELFRLSIPYQVAIDLTHDTFTFVQRDES